MKCELLPVLLGDLSHMWILWSWSLSRSIHLDFPLPSPHPLAFGNLLLLRLSLPCQKGNCHTSVGIIWIKVYIQLLEPRMASYTHVHPCIKYCWESNYDVHSVPLLALPTEPLRSSWSLFSQFRMWEHWPDKMQILFTGLAHVSINARVQHTLLSPQSASLARANEPPHIMWWQERQRLLEQKPGGHEENLLWYWSFPLKAERNGFFANWEENLSLCHIQMSHMWIPFVTKKEQYLGFMYTSAFQVKVQAHCTAQHAWILLDWKKAGNKCTHLAT